MKIFWIHSDCLGAAPAGNSVFIFDPQQIERERWGIKRLLFLYESVPPVAAILRGDTVSLLAASNQSVTTEDSPDPWIRSRIDALRQRGVAVEVLPPPPFGGLRPEMPESDLKRFSRYWKRVESRLLS
jgi:hypothetical protein